MDTGVARRSLNAAVTRPWNNVELLSCEFALSAVYRRKLYTVGSLVMALELVKLVVCHPNLVARDSSYEFITGHDILQRCECVIDVASRTLPVGHSYVKIKTESWRRSTFALHRNLSACENQSLKKGCRILGLPKKTRNLRNRCGSLSTDSCGMAH